MRRETRGRKGRRLERSGAVRQLPWRAVRNTWPPMEMLNEEQLAEIEAAAFSILEEIGMDFLHPDALDLLRKAGADVEAGTSRVRLDRDLVREALAHAPERFTLHARNPEHDVVLGDDWIAFASVASAPNASDLETGRRAGNYDDYRNFLRLAQSLNIIHLFGGYPVEPTDLPPAVRHLHCIRDFLVLTDKVFHAYSLGRTRIRDALELARLGHGLTPEELTRTPVMFTVVNSSSPLRLDGPMIEGLIEMARHNQPVVLTPFTLAGAMCPTTLAGALAQQHAEAMAGLALVQIANPGAPVVYGGFTSNVDMRSGAPAFGTPEYVRAVQVGGQLARRLKLPYRSSNVNASTSVDVQAAYESGMSLWATVMSRTNLVMHAAGWLESGLCASFEKMVVDAETLQLMAESLVPLEVNEGTIALDAIREVGPGGHFFGSVHTLERYETAFYSPMLSDWQNYGAWLESGGSNATERAHHLYRRLLSEYQEPVIDPAIREALDAFVERRIAEGGAEAA